MWYYIRRKSDNNYLTRFKLSFWESTEWSDEIELAECVIIGKCQTFMRKFDSNDEFELIPVND